MKTITIRDVPESVILRLRVLAAEAGMSREAYLRAILAADVPINGETLESAQRRVTLFQERYQQVIEGLGQAIGELDQLRQQLRQYTRYQEETMKP